jgi:hypothetical protein
MHPRSVGWSRSLLGIALALFLLAQMTPSALAQGGQNNGNARPNSSNARQTPPDTISKRLFPRDGFEPVVGGTVIFQVSFVLGRAREQLYIVDALLNAGKAPDTEVLTPNDVPQSPVLFGPPAIGTVQRVPFVLARNHVGRIVYVFRLGALPEGQYHFFYDVRLSNKLRCGSSVTNRAALRTASQRQQGNRQEEDDDDDRGGHRLASARTTFVLGCPSAPARPVS